MIDARWSVHVLAWNDPRYFFDLVSSLEQQRGTHAHIILIEHVHTNAISSTDVDHHRCVVLRNAREKGFGASHAQAVQFALSHWSSEVRSQRYVVIAHPDCVFAPDSLFHAEQVFEQQPQVQVIFPRMLCAQLAFSDKGEERRVIFSDDEEIGDARPCLFLRASILSELSFKSLSEEKAVRAFLKQCDRHGWKKLSVPESVIWHHAHHLPASSFFAKVRSSLWNLLSRLFA